ncbi:glycerophosphodiester phosphodiesterase family protein [Niabella sp.]|uniref:glycerophosphodiester phosphodiesterase n=1 Tax=Niabella sp. TaxID=1962976 RepID=UPI00262FB32E|nr:glycerophosphodiester phosphodiesterase family protein [Niabella sp.]
MKQTFLLIALAAAVCAGFSPKAPAVKPKTKVIAHQGYWKPSGSTNNSLESLRQAASIAAYGSEFDVNITSDNVAIISHGPKLNGMVIETTPYSAFREIRLPNGEPVPTLEQYLEEGKKHPDLKLILELKSASSPEVERRWVEIVTEMVDRMKMRKQVEYISFSLYICKELSKKHPKVPVAYLRNENPIAPKDLKASGINHIDYSYITMLANPDWFAQARKLGMKVNVWTVNDEETLRRLIALGADFITTDDPLLLQAILSRPQVKERK